jgi:hypothetical protein
MTNGETRHLTPTLSPFCSADFAKHGEGETLPASRRLQTPILARFTQVLDF